ncbi:hypothetical protein VPHK24_0080 [Vibrio phage K24]|nr:hypothetical protein SIPHO078v2_p0065 [Vibrio phage 14E30.1]QZI92509.1 hypothetical protein SIPHO058v2_p0061 [Vibrio phage 14E30.2]
MKGRKLNLVVRLVHNNYLHNDKLISKSSLILLKRKSTGAISDLIEDPDYDLSTIDLRKYDSGIYFLTTKNESYDIESGYLDSWDLQLKPYSTEEIEEIE